MDNHPSVMQTMTLKVWCWASRRHRCVKTLMHKSISSGAQHVTLQKCFSHPSFSCLLLFSNPTPPIKLKLGLQICGRLLIATHLDQSNYVANHKQGAVNIVSRSQLDMTTTPPRFPVQGHITNKHQWRCSKASLARTISGTWVMGLGYLPSNLQ